MIKGINRHVIEVTKTDNIYYERAILIVRPEFTGEEKRLLEKEAKRMLKELNPPSVIKSRSQLIKRLLLMIMPMMAGAVLTLCFLGILGAIY